MIKLNIFNFYFFFSKYINLMLSFILILFIFFNSLFLTFSYLYRADLSKIVNIQSDVISAVFVVTNVIDKVNNTLCFGTKVNKQAENESQNSPIEQKNKTFIDVININNCFNSEIKYEKYFAKFILCEDLLYFFDVGLCSKNSCNDINNFILVYSMAMLCLFASAMKLYDSGFLYKKVYNSLFYV